jgi:putative ABC transport system permease protein
MKKEDPFPPGLFLRFFRWFCHPALKKYVEGDLMELYDERVEALGKRKADLRFVFDVLLLFRPGIIRPTEGYHNLSNYGMFKNYFKVGIRNILKYKAFSFINVFGLALAMSVCMLIILMLADQLSYDQFHEKKDRTFRVLSKIQQSATANASSPFPLAAAIKDGYPIIEASTHLVPGVGGDAIYEQKAIVMRGYFADASFFNVFGFELKMGNKSKALISPNSMVITSEMAVFLFDDENPIGKIVQFVDRGLRIISIDLGSEIDSNPVNWGSYTITGIIDSKIYKSHLKFDVLVSTSSLPTLYHEGKIADFSNDWQRYSLCYTYVVLNPEKTALDLTASLDDLVKKRYAGFEDLEGFRLMAQNLEDITPGIFVGNPPSLQLPIEAYYFLGLLALVIMVSACVNYTNLSVARALTRAKEIGMRKVSGAKRTNLVLQFLSESLIHVMFALVMAGLLLILIKPAFMELWANQYLSFDLRGNIFVYLIFLGLAFLITLFAGVIPAFHLSGYSPVHTLKKLQNEKPGKLRVRNLLSSAQFIISLFFIITSILIGRQFKHFLDFEYGFNPENIVNIPMQGNKYTLISNELAAVAGVSAVSACEFVPATAMTNGTGARIAGSQDKYISFEHSRVDANFVDNLGLRIVAGKNLPRDGNADRFILVNETGAIKLGYEFPSGIIGQVLEVGSYDEPVEVIGVMEDFRFQTPIMEDKTGPLIFRNQPEHFSYLNVKVASNDLKGTLARLEEKWKSIDPVHPFKYQFFDDQLVKVNQWLGDIVYVIGFIAFLAIIIACLGLLGMAIYTTERRTREVAIRKIMGAADTGIALLLSKQFLKLLVISILISAPLSYFINNLWLQTFPNRIDFGFGTVLLGTIILLLLGLVTIGSQTIIASKRNPVESLKVE